MPRGPSDLAPVLLDLLLKNPPAATARSPRAALLRNRAIQARLADLAMVAADERWPGFARLVEMMLQQELTLEEAIQVQA